jgi:hypothetical protein
VVLTDIYAASEAPIPGVTVEALAAAVDQHRTSPVHVVAAVDRRARRRGRPGAARRPRADVGRRFHWRRGCEARRRARTARRRKGRGLSHAACRRPRDKRFRRSRIKPSSRRSRACGGRPGSPRASWCWPAWERTRHGGACRSCQHAGAAGRAHHSCDGHERLSTGEVLALVDGLRGRNILGVTWTSGSSGCCRRRGSRTPRCGACCRRPSRSRSRAAAHRRRPHRERALPDRRARRRGGRVRAGLRRLDLPIIDGLAAPHGEGRPGGRGACRAGRSRHRRVAARPSSRRVSQIDVSDPHDAVVMLEGRPALLRLGDRRTSPSAAAVPRTGAALRERVADIDYVDLRFANGCTCGRRRARLAGAGGRGGRVERRQRGTA